MDKILKMCKESFSVYMASFIHAWLKNRKDKIRLKSILVMPDGKKYVLIYREVTAAEVGNYAHGKNNEPVVESEKGLAILQSTN